MDDSLGSSGSSAKVKGSKSSKSVLQFDRMKKALNTVGTAFQNAVVKVKKQSPNGIAFPKLIKKKCQKCTLCRKRMDKNKYECPKGSGKLYHEKCTPSPHCCICEKLIIGKCRYIPIYNLVYCRKHKKEISCSACGRKKLLRGSKFGQKDGRSLCPNCSSAVIENELKFSEIFTSVIYFMENEQHLSIPCGMRDVRVCSMDSKSLNKMSKCGATNHGVLRGITKSTCVDGVRSVTGVFILNFMPEDLCYSVIAHEAMHVLLKLNRDVPFKLHPKVEEGLCEAMAYKYLLYVEQQRSLVQSNQSNLVNGASSSDVNYSRNAEERSLLRQYLCNRIQHSKDTVYGMGFREAMLCVSDSLFYDVVNYLIQSGGSLPVCGECKEEENSDDQGILIQSLEDLLEQS